MANDFFEYSALGSSLAGISPLEGVSQKVKEDTSIQEETQKIYDEWQARVKKRKDDSYKEYFRIRKKWNLVSGDIPEEIDKWERKDVSDWDTSKIKSFEQKEKNLPKPKLITPGSAYVKDYENRTATLNDIERAIDEGQDKKIAKTVLKNQLTNFNNWFYKNEKRRWEKLDPVLQDVEIKIGGIENENLAVDTFFDGVVDSVSFGFGDQFTKHPIYGDRQHQVYGKTYVAGKIVGELISYSALSGAGKAIGAPAAIGNILSKSESAAKLVRMMGHVPSAMNKARGIKSCTIEMARAIGTLGKVTSGTLPKAVTTAAFKQGVGQVFTGSVIALSDTLKGASAKYFREDTLTENEYYKKIPMPVIPIMGFFKGIGLNVQNAPSSLAWRTALDSMYSSALQLSDIVTGVQADWDTQQFITDWMFGFLMESPAAFGKIVSKIADPKSGFDVNLKDVNDVFPENVTIKKDLQDSLLSIDDYSKKINIALNDNDRMYMSSVLKMADDLNIQRKGTALTQVERDLAIQKLFDLHLKTFTAKEAFIHPNTYRIDGDDIFKRSFNGEINVLKELATKFNWTDEHIQKALDKKILSSQKSFFEFLKDQGIIRKTSKTEIIRDNVPGISFDDFSNGMQGLIKSLQNQTSKDAGALKNSTAFQEIVNDKLLFNEFLPSKDGWEQLKKNRSFRESVHFDAESQRMRDDIVELATHPGVYSYIKKRMQKVIDKSSDAYLKDNFSSDDLAGRVLSLIDSRPDTYFKQRINYGPKKVLNDAILYIERNIESKIKTERIEKSQIKKPLRKINDFETDNVDYNILLYNAKQGADNFLNSSIRYFRDVLGMDNNEIHSHLAKFGIKKTFTQIEAAANSVFKKKNISRILKTILKNDVPVKDIYTKEDIVNIYKQSVDKLSKVNLVNGFKSDVNSHSFKTKIKNNGGFVISLNDFYTQLKSLHGDIVADNVIKNVSQFIDKFITKRNFDYASKKDPGNILIKSPDNSTFVFSFDKIDDKEAKDIIGDLYNVLAKRYDDSEQSSPRQFSLIISKSKDPGVNDYVINQIRDISISYTKDPDSIVSFSKRIDIIKDIVNKNYPEYRDKFNNIIFNYENDKIRSAVNDMFSFIEGSDLKNVSPERIKPFLDIINEEIEIPNTLPQLIRSDYLYDSDFLLGITKKEIDANKYSNNNLDNDKHLDDTLSQYIRDIDDDSDVSTITREATESARQWLLEKSVQVISEARKLSIEQSKEQLSFLGKVKLKARTAKEQLGEWIVNRNDIYRGQKQKFDESISTIKELASEKEYIKSSIVPNILKSIDSDIVDKYFSSPKSKGLYQSFNYIKDWARGKEFSLYYENKASYKRGIDIEERLRTPIKMAPNASVDFDKFISNPYRMLSQDFYNIKLKTNDDLLWSKILVQHFGIEPRDLINYFEKEDKIYYVMLREIASEVGGYLGYYVNNDLVSNVRENIIKDVYTAIQVRYPSVKELDFNTEVGQEEIARYIRDIIKTDPDTGYRIALRMKQYIENDPNNISYVHHVVLADPYNQELFKKEIASDLSTSEAGRYAAPTETYRGEKLLSPMLDELKGRKTHSMMDLAESGYKFNFDSWDVKQATLSHVMTKKADLEFAKGFVKKYKEHFYNYFNPVKKELELMQKVSKDTAISDTNKFKSLSTSLNKLREMETDLANSFGDTGGVHFIPVQAVNARLQKNIKNARDILSKKHELNIDENLAAKYQKIIDYSESEIESNKDLMNTLNGNLFTIGEKIVLDFRAKTDIPNLKIDSKTKNAGGKKILEKREAFKERIRGVMHQDGTYMPMDVKSHTEALESWIGGKNKKGNISEQNIKELLSDYKTEIPRDRLYAPGRLPGFEGLYFNDTIHSVLKQLIFRSDYLRKQDFYSAEKKAYKVFDTFNQGLKFLQLCKPTIVGTYDIAQSNLATNLFSLRYAKNVTDAYKMTTEKFKPNSEFGRRYKLYNNNGLYNHMSGPSIPLTQATREMYNMLGEDRIWGFEAAFKELFRRGKRGISVAVREEQDAIKRAKRIAGEILEVGKGSWRTYQDITWSLDEFVRTATANSMWDKFYPVQLADAKRKYAGSSDANIKMIAERETAKRASDWTNLFLVEYDRIPSATKKKWGRLVRFYTYRASIARMYGFTIKQFNTGLIRLIYGSQKAGDPYYKFSDNRIKQSLAEMGPAMRLVLGKLAVKSAIVGIYGYHFDSTLDAIRGYRLKRTIDEDDPQNKYMKFLSLSTPLFDIEKYMTRPLQVTLRYNVAALPGLFWSMASNRNLITGQRIVTVPWSEHPIVASSQVGLDILKTYFPFGSDISNLHDSDLDLMSKLLNFSGLAYFYNIDSPEKLMSDFQKSIDKASTYEEREAARRTFESGLKHASDALFKSEYSDKLSDIEEAFKLQNL